MYEGARHGQGGTGQRGTAGTPVTSLPTPMSATRGPQPEAQGRRTEESKRSVTQNNDNDFNSPFWNKARGKVNGSLGYNHRRQQSYAQVTSSADSAPVKFCLYCGEDNHYTRECRHGRKIKCYECNRLGHKGKLCHMYSLWIVGQNEWPSNESRTHLQMTNENSLQMAKNNEVLYPFQTWLSMKQLSGHTSRRKDLQEMGTALYILWSTIMMLVML